MPSERMQALVAEIESGKTLTLHGYRISSVAELERVCQYPNFIAGEAAQHGEPVKVMTQPVRAPKKEEPAKVNGADVVKDDLEGTAYQELKKIAHSLELNLGKNPSKVDLIAAIREKRKATAEAAQ